MVHRAEQAEGCFNHLFCHRFNARPDGQGVSQPLAEDGVMLRLAIASGI
ncbi:MAG: hypothetical protein KME12_16420 [Trichocoleus desertorum ATA4-8-CV12]|nr:hypothetical protein [Trichocoleus desertorum ATA4-8-CV12]